MLDIEIVNDQEEREITDQDLELIRNVLQETAKLEEIADGEVSVSLVDNQTIHQLNKDYRNIDRPTDVLSFAMNESVDDDMEIFYEEEDEFTNMLGDIIISIPRTVEQANDYRHSFSRELGFLSVHGFLHLLGYDHEDEESEKIMFAKQEEVLNRLNLLR